MEGVLFCCEVGKVGSRVDGSLSVTLDLPELDGAKVGQVFNLRKKVAYVYISSRQIDNNEMKVLDSLDPELKGKTPGQRLRATLYVWHDQNKSSDPTIPQDFEAFYRQRMEAFIQGIKHELL
jgi:hypothetical protein